MGVIVSLAPVAGLVAAPSPFPPGPLPVPQVAHNTAITAAAWSQDGQWIATGAKDSTIVIWDVTRGMIARRLPIAPSLEERGDSSSSQQRVSITKIEFSDSDRFLAASESFYSGSHTRIWSTSDTRAFCEIKSGFIGWLPHANRLMVVDDRVVRLMDAGDCRQQLQLSPHRVRMGAVAASPDGRWLAHAASSVLAEHDDRVIISDTGDGSDRLILRPDPDGADDVAFVQDGRTLAIRGHNGTLYLYDAASGRLIHRLDLTPLHCDLRGYILATAHSATAAVSCVRISAGRYIDSTLIVDLQQGVVTARLSGRPRALSPDGWLFMEVPDTEMTGVVHSAQAVQLGTGRSISLGPQVEAPIAFSRDGGRFLANRIMDRAGDAYVPENDADRDDVPQISTLPDGHWLKSLRPRLRLAPSRAAVSDDAGLLAMITPVRPGQRAEAGRDVAIYSLPDLALRRSASVMPGRNAAFLPASHVLMLEGGSSTVLLSALDGSTQTLPLPRVAPVLAAPGSFVGVDGERRIVLYDQAHGRVVRSFDMEHLDGSVQELVASAAQDRVAAALHVFGRGGAHWGGLALWQLSTGRYLGAVDDRLGAINRLTLLGDAGEVITSESYTHVASAWSLAGLTEMGRFAGRKDGVDAVAGSRDGKYLATAGSGFGGDRAVQVWDHAHHSLVATLEGHSADIQNVWFLGSSYAVLVQTEDGVLSLWDGPSGDLLTTVYRSEDGAWLVVDPRGRFDTAGKGDRDLIAWRDPGGSREPLPAGVMREARLPGLLQRYLACESGRQADPDACAKAFPVRPGP